MIAFYQKIHKKYIAALIEKHAGKEATELREGHLIYRSSHWNYKKCFWRFSPLNRRLEFLILSPYCRTVRWTYSGMGKVYSFCTTSSFRKDSNIRFGSRNTVAVAEITHFQEKKLLKIIVMALFKKIMSKMIDRQK